VVYFFLLIVPVYPRIFFQKIIVTPDEKGKFFTTDANEVADPKTLKPTCQNTRNQSVKVKRRFSQIHTFLFISFGGLPET
jgi:hypothetical protein